MADKIQVLIVEDQPADAALAIHELRRAGLNAECRRVDNEQDYLQQLDFQTDVILADYNLPAFDALRAHKLLRERKLDVPFIIVSGSIGEDLAVAAMREGVADYVIKDRMERLGETVKQSIDHKRLRDAKRYSDEMLALRARLAALNAEVGQALTHGQSLPVMLQACLESVVQYLDVSLARIWTLDRAGDVLELQASAGLYIPPNNSYDRIQMGDFKVGWIAEQRLPILTNDLLRNPQTLDKEWIELEGLVGFAGYPLVVGEHLVGVLAMFSRHALAETTFDALASVANQLALGIERRLSEDSLRESHRMLQAVIDAAPLAIVSVDRTTNVAIWNDVASTMFGWGKPEVLGRPLPIVPPDQRRDFAALLRQKLDGGSLSSCETVRQHKNGTLIDVNLWSTPLLGPTGEVTGVLGLYEDITERKRAERHLLAQYAATRILAESSTIEEAVPRILEALCEALDWPWGAIWLVNRGDHRAQCEHIWHVPGIGYESFAKASRLIGIAPGVGVAGQVWSSREPIWIENVTDENFWPRQHAAQESGLRSAVAFPVICKGEVVGVIEFFSRDIRTCDQPVLHMMATIGSQMGQFIERKLAEDNRDRFVQVLEAATDLVVTADSELRPLYINRAGRKLLDIGDDEEITSLSLAAFTSEWVREVMENTSIPEAIRTGAWQGEINLCTRDGMEFPVSLVLMSHKAADGSVDFFSAIARDISEMKRTQLMLREKDAQIRQAQKMEAVGTLAGGVAHEFNNLLQAIQGYTSYAMEGVPRESQPYSDLEQVVAAATRASTLTRQLLSFSRQQVLQPTACDPNEITLELVKLLRPLIGAHIKLEMELADDVGTIWADPGQVHQVLLNLCVNARDAMPAGGLLRIQTSHVELSPTYCELYPHCRPGSYMLLTVGDTGCGMTAEQKRHIFEPFFTTKEVGKGTGLGLAMVYGMVQQHGGLVHVYSEPGEGTEFKIYLPASDRVAMPTEKVSHPTVAVGTETILVAEDEALVRNLTVRILQKAGYSVLTADDGEEAVRVFKEHADEIDLVLLDVVMPKMSGREVLGHLRELVPDVPVVFCSGYDPETGHAEFISDEGLPLVQKPFDHGVLLATLREQLDRVPC